jgi:hypothetical protein
MCAAKIGAKNQKELLYNFPYQKQKFENGLEV